MMGRFYSMRNVALGCASCLLLWRYVGFNLSDVEILKSFWSQAPDRVLVLLLLAILFLLNLDMVLLVNSEKNDANSLHRKHLLFTIGCSVVAVLLSIDDIFKEFGIVEVERFKAIAFSVLGLVVAIVVVNIVVSVEYTVTIYRYRKSITSGGVVSIFVPLFILIGLLWLFFALLSGLSSLQTFYMYGSIYLAFLIPCYLIERPGPLFAKEGDQERLKRMSDKLDRELEVSKLGKDYHSHTKAHGGPHRVVKKWISYEQKKEWTNSVFKGEWLEDVKDFVQEDGSINIEQLDDELECIEFSVTNKKNQDIETIILKAKYIKQASEYVRNEAPKLKKGRKMIGKRDSKLFLQALVYAKYLQVMAEGDSGQMLVICAPRGSLEDLKNLINKRTPNINHKEENEGGWSALLFAVADGAIDKAQYLLQKGADPNICNDLGAFPVAFAATYGNRDMCNLLISFGADLNQYDFDGQTALMKASTWGHTGIVSLLLSNGANARVTDMCQKTALDYALEKGFGEIGKLLRKEENKTADEAHDSIAY